MFLLAVRRSVIACALGLLTIGAVVPVASVSAEVHSNTQQRLPSNLYLADVNGDGRADLLQIGANKLFAFNTDYAGTPILHKYFDQNVSRLITGDFASSGREHGKDQVCAILVDNSFACYAISDDGTDLWWWFTQQSFIASDEQAIVGDFDGDGADDILVYKPSTGSLRMFSRAATGFFQAMPAFSLGNLLSADRLNKKLFAGEFGQATGRSDLLVFDPATGQISRYDSVTDSAGYKTFWWAFTTAGSTVSSTEDVLVARIENSTHDSIVLRNRLDGRLRLRQAEYANGGLATVAGVSLGQLPQSGNGALFFAKTALFKEPGGATREDALFFDFSAAQLSKYDGRWDGSQYTYWWAYTKNTPNLNTGWSGVIDDPWTLVLCTYSGVSGLPQGATFWRNHFTFGTGGVADYFWDMSYGSRDVSGTRIIGPYSMSISPVAGRARDDIAKYCRDAAVAKGATVPTSKVIFYVNVAGDDGRGSGSFVVADPSLNSPMAMGHEMSHVYGVNDSADDRGGWYGDPYDVMSAMQGYCFAGPAILASADNGCFSPTTSDWAAVANTAAGPGLNAGNRIALNMLPSSRVRLLTPGGGRQSVSLDVAGLDRPEGDATAGGAVQAIRIAVANGPVAECVTGNTCQQTGNYYSIELREPRGWDQGFPRSAVLIHKVGVTNGMTQTYLKKSPLVEYTAGTTFQDGAITVRVHSIDVARGVANVTVTY